MTKKQYWDGISNKDKTEDFKIMEENSYKLVQSTQKQINITIKKKTIFAQNIETEKT